MALAIESNLDKLVGQVFVIEGADAFVQASHLIVYKLKFVVHINFKVVDWEPYYLCA
jgi:hypothetical protein